ncbi:ATP-binding protein [Rhodococcus sp. Eu-32]|uniref:ATP-binding protein n=1 Tax=Rhodococcus sp. Eu-32 TaxID=1017319 RepID=UPI000DF45F30|nr:ATP-binding protein [Rhodococcus sp. Eu-32]RRQ25291.1 ATP-binding protein [Rhodococcus sp. Eu-32]
MADTAMPTGATGSPSPPIELMIADVPATPDNAAAVRHTLSSWLTAAGIDPDRRPDVELAVYEALANTVEHAYHDAPAPAPGTFTVHACYPGAGHVLEVAVSDHGRWRTPTPDPVRGNGLPLITAVTTGSEVTPSGEGTTVTMRWNTDVPAQVGATNAR